MPNVQNPSAGIESRNNTGNEQLSNSDVNGGLQSNASLPRCTSESEVQKVFYMLVYINFLCCFVFFTLHIWVILGPIIF